MSELYFNREQRRKLKRRLNNSGITVDDAIELMERRLRDAGSEALPEGTLVKLNTESICETPGYAKRQEAYRAFVEANKETVFEVRYDEKHKSGKLVLLHNIAAEEDEEDAPWLWYVSDLIVQKANEGANADGQSESD